MLDKFLTFSLCLCILFCCCSCSESDRASNYYSDYDAGYADGVYDGFESGYEEGYQAGCDDSEYLSMDGYSDGYEEGYADGHDDGYYDGATYTCMFFKDVDRAFRSANNGGAWYTFVDAYDEYVFNIYDSDEERSDLVWSLVSATNNSGLTEDEQNLLVSKFGRDLFLRNGIDIYQLEKKE